MTRILAFVFTLCWIATVHAEIAIPPLSSPITDLTGTITPAQKNNLEQMIGALEKKKGSQIAVLIIPTTDNEPIEQYSLRVVEQWKLGRKDVDDGALLIVAKDDHTLRIEVGYGLEGVLNDAVSKRIISEVIVPKFKQGDFYGGISAGVDQIARLIEGESLPPPPKDSQHGRLVQWTPYLFLLVFSIGGALTAALGRMPGAVVTGGIATFLTWLLAGTLIVALGAGIATFLFILLNGVIGRNGGWYAGGGLNGGFGSGTFGGGQYGGGGGTFGGGGASGRW